MDKHKSASETNSKQKQFYTVKMEVSAPVLLTYRVYAESPEQAIELVQKQPFQSLSEAPKPFLSRMRKLKATVYAAGNSLIQLTKNLGV